MLTNYLNRKRRAEPDDTVSSEEAQKLRVAIEERDEAIVDLELTVSEQQAQIESLEHALEQEKFKAGILEQSYATQLREARERAEVAGQSIADQQTRIEELESNEKKLSRELAGVRARLEPFGPDPASIDELMEKCLMPREDTRSRDSDNAVDASAGPQVPEEMLAPDIYLTEKDE